MKDGRFVNCIFCDDVRQEVGGKTSLMGIYLSELLIETQSIPISLPKFAAHFFIVSPINNLPKKISAWITSPTNDEVGRLEAEISGVATAEIPEDVTRLTLGFTALVSPMLINGEGPIEAWVEVDGERERAGRLEIRITIRERQG